MNLTTLRLGVVLVAVTPLLASCTYLSNRGKDFTDIVSFGVSTGGGIMLRARATRLVTLEAGVQKDERYYGWSRRHGRWEESSYGLPFSFFWSPTVGREKPADWSWWDLIKTSHTKLNLLETNVPYEETKYHLFVLTNAESFHWVHALDVEISAGALLGGIQLTVRPGELLDLLAGFVFLDPAGDDAQADSEPAPAAATSAP